MCNFDVFLPETPFSIKTNYTRTLFLRLPETLFSIKTNYSRTCLCSSDGNGPGKSRFVLNSESDSSFKVLGLSGFYYRV
jgi:hypothetical protein